MLISHGFIVGFCAYVVINSNAPVVVGGTVTFTAVLHDYNPLVFVNQVQFDWRDSGVPEHNRTVWRFLPVSTFVAHYLAISVHQ